MCTACMAGRYAESSGQPSSAPRAACEPQDRPSNQIKSNPSLPPSPQSPPSLSPACPRTHPPVPTPASRLPQSDFGAKLRQFEWLGSYQAVALGIFLVVPVTQKGGLCLHACLLPGQMAHFEKCFNTFRAFKAPAPGPTKKPSAITKPSPAPAPTSPATEAATGTATSPGPRPTTDARVF